MDEARFLLLHSLKLKLDTPTFLSENFYLPKVNEAETDINKRASSILNVDHIDILSRSCKRSTEPPTSSTISSGYFHHPLSFNLPYQLPDLTFRCCLKVRYNFRSG